MPELPEVEITRRGIAPALVGRRVSGGAIRAARLRYPLCQELPKNLKGKTLLEVGRRGKYLLLYFGRGAVLVHLGMSGSLRLLPRGAAPQKHDHVDLEFGDRLLRMHDPRRFGAVLWFAAKADMARHPLLLTLGIEPLEADFTPEWLFAATRGRQAPIKQLLMDSHLVVGIGNIYASESLYRAGIDPRTPAGRIGLKRFERLVAAIRTTLQAAIDAGGSSLRDFIHSDGSSGYFQQQYFVYGRAGEACRVCRKTIRSLRQGQRATFFCPHCQRA
ncbi:MAG: bifunctional DNA-formamidopyrimidine glycosylase/DNA-(apurinic or apyrimidinic site) lyase [Proteobacteria bacterium]|nr:bifunctional DNA-formamidopyrimidine glycosylase/DNA-(apurinic or apyrimidinic site) lyase [Pseudomonadota bacterium]